MSRTPDSERVIKWRKKKPNHYREYMKKYMREKRAREKREREEAEHSRTGS